MWRAVSVLLFALFITSGRGGSGCLPEVCNASGDIFVLEPDSAHSMGRDGEVRGIARNAPRAQTILYNSSRLGAESGPIIAETATGKVKGIDLNGIKHFRGIPYGGSTAGKNRFMPPTKAAKWGGVRDGSEWGHIAPQHLVTNPGDYEKTIQWHMQRGGVGEDCLNLNIWTPAQKDGNKRTVMVSYHGGGFTTGSGNLPVYDGEPLARFGDVVVVTVNHRLGTLG